VAFGNTLLISLITALIQTFICCLIAYGLAKYKFKGNGAIFILVMLTMIIPHRTLKASMALKFINFDILGILSFLSGGASIGIEGVDNFLSSIKVLDLASGINLTNTYWPIIILSLTGLAFKNGLYIFMLRQFFRGIPDSLEESAYIDGSGDFRTFFQIILPMSVPMMITVFLFAFCWQWTDSFYTNMFLPTPGKAPLLLSSTHFVDIPETLDIQYAGKTLYDTAIINTCGIMLIAPLVILYIFLQRYLVEGIERSGLTAE
jgi:multiple sugar transport system permease protein